MMATVKSWFVARSRREQRLLLAMAALAACVLAWALWMRITSVYQDALQRNLDAADRHGQVRALADSLNSKGRPQGEAPADLQVVLTETAAQAGLAVQNLNAAGRGAATIDLSAPSAPQATQWLRDLDARGIVVRQLRMAPQPDASVSVSATFARRP